MNPSAPPGGGPHHQLVDEEDCLGLELFVAELELVLGPQHSRPDQTQLLELLQKLQASIGGAGAPAVKRCQRRCEAALADLLRRGLCGPVRALAAACMSKLFAAGDMLPLYGRVSALQGELAEKDRGAASEVRAAHPSAAACFPLAPCACSLLCTRCQEQPD